MSGIDDIVRGLYFRKSKQEKLQQTVTRIEQAMPRTQEAIARIEQALPCTQEAIARVESALRSQLSNVTARIEAEQLSSREAIARIEATIAHIGDLRASRQGDLWRQDVSELLKRGMLHDAKTLLRELTRQEPTDPDRWRALMEVAAAEDDYSTCRLALTHYLQAFRGATDESCQNLEPIWLVNDDVRLKLAQLWVELDHRNVFARVFLSRALECFSWYVPPTPETESVEEVYARYGESLAAFEAEFSTMHGELTQWGDWIHRSDIIGFRGETYVSQASAHRPFGFFGAGRLLDAYTVAYEYALACDRLGVLGKFSDDGSFGGVRFQIDGRVVSRDIIDSSLELNFVARHCGFTPSDEIALLDIGAGWGRFVHRFLEFFPRASAFALDAVPFSSFLAQRYLGHRGVIDRVVIGSRAKLEAARPGSFQIATNIHSWSEAPLASVEQWLEKLDVLQVPFLFFVPHETPAFSLEKEGPGKLIVPRILAHGWQVLVEQPIYGDSVKRQQTGLYPFAHYYLFHRPS